MNNNRCIQQLSNWKQTTSTKSTNTTQHKTLHHQQKQPNKASNNRGFAMVCHMSRLNITKENSWITTFSCLRRKKWCLNPPTPKKGKKYLATPRININQTTIQHLHFNPNPPQFVAPQHPLKRTTKVPWPLASPSSRGWPWLPCAPRNSRPLAPQRPAAAVMRGLGMRNAYLGYIEMNKK